MKIVKSYLLFFVVFAMSVLLSACGKGDYDTFGNMHKNHDLMETARITNQSNAIAAIATEAAAKEEDPTVRALMKVIAMDKIADLTPAKLDVKAPTTGMDVANNVAGQIPMIVLGGTASWMGYQMAENMGNHFTLNDQAHIDGSFNPTNTSTWKTQSDNITGNTTTTEAVIPEAGALP